MQRVACKDAAEVSCTIANLIAELEQPCGQCRADGVVLTGTSPLGGSITVRLLPENVLEVTGGDDLLEQVRGRMCGDGN